VSRFLSPAVQSLMDTDSALPPSGALSTRDDPSVRAGGVAAVDRMLAELWS